MNHDTNRILLNFYSLEFDKMSEKYIFTHSGIKKIQLRRNMSDKHVVLHASRNIVICRARTQTDRKMCQ